MALQAAGCWTAHASAPRAAAAAPRWLLPTLPPPSLRRPPPQRRPQPALPWCCRRRCRRCRCRLAGRHRRQTSLKAQALPHRRSHAPVAALVDPPCLPLRGAAVRALAAAAAAAAKRLGAPQGPAPAPAQGRLLGHQRNPLPAQVPGGCQGLPLAYSWAGCWCGEPRAGWG